MLNEILKRMEEIRDKEEEKTELEKLKEELKDSPSQIIKIVLNLICQRLTRIN